MAKEISLDLRKQIKDVFADIEHRTNILKALMVDSGLEHIAYQIPTRTMEDEPPKRIEFSTLKGEDAWDAALEVYGQFYRTETQHARATVRVPGLVFVNNFEEIVPHIQKINSLKDTLKALFRSISGSQRNRIATQTLPGVVLLQVYRHIDFYSEEVRRLVFTWVRTDSIKILDKEYAIEAMDKEIDNHKKNPSGHADLSPAEWLEELERVKEVVSGFSSTQEIRFIKPISPHPRLVLFGDSSKAIETYHANMPLIMPVPKNIPRVRELKPFDSARQIGTHSNKQSRVSLSKYMYWYIR